MAYYWYQELLEGFRTRLRSAIVTSSAMIHPDEIPASDAKKNKNPRAFLFEALKEIQAELDITHLYIIQMKPNLKHEESAFPYLFHTVALSPFWSMRKSPTFLFLPKAISPSSLKKYSSPPSTRQKTVLKS